MVVIMMVVIMMVVMMVMAVLGVIVVVVVLLLSVTADRSEQRATVSVLYNVTSSFFMSALRVKWLLMGYIRSCDVLIPISHHFPVRSHLMGAVHPCRCGCPNLWIALFVLPLRRANLHSLCTTGGGI